MAGAEVEQSAAIPERRRGTQRALTPPALGVDPDLGERGLGLRGALGKTTVRTRAARRHAVEELAAARLAAALELAEVALGTRIAGADRPARLDNDDPVRESLRSTTRAASGAGLVVDPESIKLPLDRS